MHSQQKSIAIEGNIGSPIDYFLSLTKAYFNVHIKKPIALQKPIDELDQRMFQNAPRWSYSFLTRGLLSHVQYESKKKGSHTHVVNMMSRSLFSAYHCFGISAQEMGFLDRVEWDLYSQFYEYINKENRLPDAFIYIRTHPDWIMRQYAQIACNDQIKKYLHMVHEVHEKLFSVKREMNKQLAGIPVFILELPSDIERHKEIQDELMEEVAQFMDSLINNGHETESWQLNL